MTGEPVGVLDDGLIAQLALAKELLDVPAKRNSRSLYKSSDYITMNLLNLAITPGKAGLAALTDFRTKLRAADVQVRAAVASARSVLFGGVLVGSTLAAELFWRQFRDKVEESSCVPATVKKGEQICRVCDITRAKKMLDELKGKTGKDQVFLEGIASRFKSIWRSKAGCGAGIVLLRRLLLAYVYFLCNIIISCDLHSMLRSALESLSKSIDFIKEQTETEIYARVKFYADVAPPCSSSFWC